MRKTMYFKMLQYNTVLPIFDNINNGHTFEGVCTRLLQVLWEKTIAISHA